MESDNILLNTFTVARDSHVQPRQVANVLVEEAKAKSRWISEKRDRYFQHTMPAKYENDPDTFTLRYPSASL